MPGKRKASGARASDPGNNPAAGVDSPRSHPPPGGEPIEVARPRVDLKPENLVGSASAFVGQLSDEAGGLLPASAFEVGINEGHLKYLEIQLKHKESDRKRTERERIDERRWMSESEERAAKKAREDREHEQQLCHKNFKFYAMFYLTAVGFVACFAMLAFGDSELRKYASALLLSLVTALAGYQVGDKKSASS